MNYLAEMKCLGQKRIASPLISTKHQIKDTDYYGSGGVISVQQ